MWLLFYYISCRAAGPWNFWRPCRWNQRSWNSFCAQRSSQTFDVQNLSVPTIKFLQWFPESQIEHSDSLLHNCLYWKSNWCWKVHVQCTVHLKEMCLWERQFKIWLLQSHYQEKWRVLILQHKEMGLNGEKAAWHEPVKSWKVYKGLIPQLLGTAAVLWHTDWCTSCLIHRFHF